MGARKLFLLGTRPDGLFGAGGGFLNDGFLYGDMLWAVESFWALLCNVLLCALGSVSRYIFRTYQAGADGSERDEQSCHFYDLQRENCDSYASIKEAGHDQTTENIKKDDHHSFSGDKGESVLLETSLSKYRFSFRSDIIESVEEPKVPSFTIQEPFESSIDSTTLSACNFSEEAIVSLEKIVDVEETESVKCFGVENALDKETKSGNFGNDQTQKVEGISSENEHVAEENSNKVGIFSENSAPKIDVEVESVDSGDGFYMNSKKIDSFINEAVLEEDDKVDSCSDEGLVGGSFWPVDEGLIQEVEEKPTSEESYVWDEDLAEPEVVSSGEDQQDQSDEDDNGGFVEMELQEDNFFVENSRGAEFEYGQQKLDNEESGQAEYGDQNDLNSSWEHDEIIEQLRQELKAARTGGLPTILEEPELEEESKLSPTKMDDDRMKPLKITNPKLEHKGRIMEIQKIYRSYAERMRKLDVLNCQTMHAIGLLHLKDPLKSNATERPPTPMIKSLLSQKLWPIKLRRNKIGPAVYSMEAFYGDLEMIYIGQACLSWEMLRWQYGKSWELLGFDPHGYRQYNCVAGEIQLFQVLLHRFIENEPFQGPRIENYVKNRCVVRSLLQVPALKDDSFSEKKARVGEEDAVPTAALVQVMEETIRLFWDFVHSDKGGGDAIHGACKKTQSNLLDSADIDLLITTRNQLQKKERKLKDILRSGNCIVKRFQKHRERGDKMLMLVFAQVEVRLISRVLNMAKVTRDQVLWCHEKLDRINFVSRKIHVEPSFLLFPC